MNRRDKGGLYRRILDGHRELLSLQFKECRDGWTSYEVKFKMISEQDWIEQTSKDPRDVSFAVEKENGDICSFAVSACDYHAANREIMVKYGGMYSTRPAGGWFSIRRLVGGPILDVPQARAPCSWRIVSRRQLLRELGSKDEEDVVFALSAFTARVVRSRDLEWAGNLLVQFLLESDLDVDIIAVRGMSELARVSGYSTPRIIDSLRALAQETPRISVRKAAEEALETIARFAGK